MPGQGVGLTLGMRARTGGGANPRDEGQSRGGLTLGMRARAGVG